MVSPLVTPLTRIVGVVLFPVAAGAAVNLVKLLVARYRPLRLDAPTETPTALSTANAPRFMNA